MKILCMLMCVASLLLSSCQKESKYARILKGTWKLKRISKKGGKDITTEELTSVVLKLKKTDAFGGTVSVENNANFSGTKTVNLYSTDYNCSRYDVYEDERINFNGYTSTIKDISQEEFKIYGPLCPCYAGLLYIHPDTIYEATFVAIEKR